MFITSTKKQGSLMCWVNPTSVLWEANDLYTSFGKALLLELVFGIKEAHEGLLDPYWLVTNAIRA